MKSPAESQELLGGPPPREAKINIHYPLRIDPSYFTGERLRLFHVGKKAGGCILVTDCFGA